VINKRCESGINCGNTGKRKGKKMGCMASPSEKGKESNQKAPFRKNRHQCNISGSQTAEAGMLPTGATKDVGKKISTNRKDR